MTRKPDLTIDEQKVLGDWYAGFVDIYPNGNCADAGLYAVYRMQPDEELRNKIMTWITKDNEIRRHHKQQNTFYRNLPNLKDFFKDKRWKDRLEETRPERAKAPNQTPLCACGQPGKVRVGDSFQCYTCYERSGR
jgi:hypothetical protein